MRVEPRFVGTFRADPVGPPGQASNEWQYRQDFGFLRSDNLLVIMPESARINGASIPRMAWFLLGHPMAGENKYWSGPHDCGYRGTLLILDMGSVKHLTPDVALDQWQYLGGGVRYVHIKEVPRSFHDTTMRQALAVCREPFWKRQVVYAVVRMFGRWAYRREQAREKI